MRFLGYAQPLCIIGEVGERNWRGTSEVRRGDERSNRILQDIPSLGGMIFVLRMREDGAKIGFSESI